VNAAATGHFELIWDEDPAYDTATGAELARVTVTKTWYGDLDGSSVAQLIKAMSPISDSAGYVAVERFTGAVHGRQGTFVLQHNAIMDRGTGTLSVVVVPDTATGELTGMRGSLHIDITDGKHVYTFDYSLPGPDREAR
jgi:Protein of unknown function (DUF3224)